ncbi:hypothetical protein OBBRIDRAFT_792801 [Obba rivulosa]|uniref:Uncharacterized protein n=1 Tax=Obba rivulosa TaxID=1052685 RepID=A0A8E2B2A0_9APHY|nr:hypothetical protein OBBRIDRAFT_792801 [Obba rivulosa]
MPGHSPPQSAAEALLRYAQEMYEYTLRLWDGAQQTAEEHGRSDFRKSSQQAGNSSQRHRHPNTLE